jgi:2-dehydro-3-deoxyglucarate aldolase/4-hydroxy-2-oxoheptanedioate aldolase
MAPTPENPLKAALAAGRRLQGAWSMSGSPVIVGALAWSGADYMVLDLEHSSTSVHGMLPLLQAAEGGGTPVLVRMADHGRTAIKQALDLGAESLMFPFVQTAEEARAIVDACLYPPKGQRGFARMTRASRYTAWADYPERAGDRTLIVLQLETPEAIDRVEEIASIDGVDAVFVGPGDLAASLGHLGQPAHAEVKAMMAACAARARRLGKPIGTVAGDPELAAWAFEVGYSFVSVSNDLAAVVGSTRTMQARLRELRGA